MGAIAELTDAGLPVHYHVGNHDLWTYGYLEEELGVSIHREPILLDCDGTLCMVGHGDGLGPGDATYKVLKKVFTSLGPNPFRTFHPDWGVKLARGWSKQSRPEVSTPWATGGRAFGPTRHVRVGGLERRRRTCSSLATATTPSTPPAPGRRSLPQPGRLADPHDLCGDSRRQAELIDHKEGTQA